MSAEQTNGFNPRLDAITPSIAKFYRVLPRRVENGVLIVACNSIDHEKVALELPKLLGVRIKIEEDSPKAIEEGLNRQYGIGSTLAEGLAETDITKDSFLSPRIQNLTGATGSTSVIGWVNQLLLKAFHDRVTDVHCEPYAEDFQIRFRIDGVLYDIPVPKLIKQHKEAVVSRLKVMANLDLGERRLPQDGRIKALVGQNELDLRISILPTLHGEAVDIRLLDRSTMMLNFSELGLSQADQKPLKEILERSFGVVLLTGPTGSGKTTTLYSALSRLNSTEKKILTIEDPVEYELKGITQIQVNPHIGLTFSSGLRSMLRHDPDIMMVGEIRDSETADVTVQVALTGHLVFSTVHTNDAPSAVARLLNMGIEPYLLSSCLQGIIAQRLVRVLCPECKRKTTDIQAGVDPGGSLACLSQAWEPVGCSACNQIGYKGRTAISQILPVDDEIRDLILNRSSSDKIMAVAKRKGMRSLRQAGAEKIEAGVTSLTEILRVTQKDGSG